MSKIPESLLRASRQKYEYVELAKVSLTNSDLQNVYGIIIDASFPHKVSEDKYVCSVKIIDPSIHSAEYAAVVIFGKRFEDLPIITKIGDIIRIHRATLRMFNNHRQFNVSTQWNGSWALFNTEDTNTEPQSYSGKRATFEKHEVTLLNTLRKWSLQYF